jgi:hypothetical protein
MKRFPLSHFCGENHGVTRALHMDRNFIRQCMFSEMWTLYIILFKNLATVPICAESTEAGFDDQIIF